MATNEKTTKYYEDEKPKTGCSKKSAKKIDRDTLAGIAAATVIGLIAYRVGKFVGKAETGIKIVEWCKF